MAQHERIDTVTSKREEDEGGQFETTRHARPTVKTKASSSEGAGFGKAAMFGIAAAGVAAGLVANVGRKAIVQAPNIAAGDWFEALKKEHVAALALFTALQNTKDNQSARRTLLLSQLKHALSKHAFTEENVIYPALRERGEKAEADKLNQDHGYVKQYLYELENMASDAPEFLVKIRDFRGALESHIREEENVLFPKLHAALGEAANKKLTALANKEGFKMA